MILTYKTIYTHQCCMFDADSVNNVSIIISNTFLFLIINTSVYPLIDLIFIVTCTTNPSQLAAVVDILLTIIYLPKNIKGN